MTTQPNAFTLSYEFNAPRQLVFEAFSNAEALNEWWGPAETRNTVISLDFRPGGIFHFKMDYNGSVTYGRFLFRTIRPHYLLEFTNAFADENARRKSPVRRAVAAGNFLQSHLRGKQRQNAAHAYRQARNRLRCGDRRVQLDQ
ncbi:SRPBCC domain-containing protein [Chitinophaga sp. MAH-28]|uniref:SRPBCC domain-containing protein n=1 Tax=Chitinophaga chungangae TaxID=2821488 RepID=A0ABS3YDF4_9BACT|nr:SRPBCC domain-containing protein [Chitinophaga chungangae]